MTQTARQRPKSESRVSVFRRRLVREYTAIANSIVNDDRLALDERGALIWMLSKPPTWQMHPGQLRKAWGVGRVVYYRIIASLMRAGYVKRGEMVRSSDNRFWVAIEYLVFDVPQEPDVEPDPQRGGDEDEGGGFGGDEDDGAGTGGVDAAGDPPTACTVQDCAAQDVASLSHAGFVHADDVHADNRHTESKKKYININPPDPPNEDERARPAGREVPHLATPLPAARAVTDGPSDNTREDGAARPPRETAPPAAPPASGPPTGATHEFAAMAVRYGLADWRNERAAQRVWLVMAASERREAYGAAPDFIAARLRLRRPLPQLKTYLRRALWKPYTAPKLPQIFTIRSKRQPQFERWCEHYARVRGKFSALLALRKMEKDGFLTVVSEWPPTLGAAAEPEEEIRAAVMLIMHYGRHDDRPFIASDGSPEMRAWLDAAKKFAMAHVIGVRDQIDFSKPPGDASRVVRGCRVPARWPPGMDQQTQPRGRDNGLDDDLAILANEGLTR